MALTEFGTNDAQTVKLWSSLTMREALKGTFFKKFLGTDKRAIIQRLKDLEKSSGDQIKFDLLMQATGAGVSEGVRLKGNEEEMTYHQDTVTIQELYNAHKFTKMSQQRTVHNMRIDAKDNLGDWFAGKFDSYMFRALCGDTSLTHGQAATAPDSEHYILAGDVSKTNVVATDEGNLSSNDQLTLDKLDAAKELAVTSTPPIRPTIVDGEEKYVVVLHPYSVVDLRNDIANSTYQSWPDIQKNAGVRGSKNPIFSGALGEYNGMVLHESTRIHSPTSNVRRNLFLGAQAGVFALGNAYDTIQRGKGKKDNLMSWFEEIDDYSRETGIGVGCMFGITKTTYNSKDYGVIVISTYAAAHSG